MKHITLITAILVGLFLSLKCTKESLDNDVVIMQHDKQPIYKTITYGTDSIDTNQAYRYYTVDDIGELESRNEPLKVDYFFPASMVRYWIFGPSQVQTAYNQTKVKYVHYKQIDTRGSYSFGERWGHYQITILNPKDSVLYTGPAFAPNKGLEYISYPDLELNQVSIVSPDTYIQITRMKAFDFYYDFFCGKAKRKFQYEVKNQSATYLDYFAGDRCISDVFSFMLVR